MTRGNQRELARAKAAKKQQDQQKKKGAGGQDGNKGTSLVERQERDADKMRQKQEAAAAKKLAESQGASGGK